MAVGIDFLSKTKMGGMKDIMKTGAASQTSQANKSNATNSIFANQKSEKAEKSNGDDVANMGTSDLLKYVYNNKSKTDNNDIKLPVTVDYKDQDFAANGRPFDEMVKIISSKTGDSKSAVESELKKKYMTAGGGKSSGGQLNMQA